MSKVENISSTEGFDSATSAFIADMTPTPIRESKKLDNADGPPERLFGGLGELSDNSEQEGGGDNDDEDDLPGRQKPQSEEDEGEGEEGDEEENKDPEDDEDGEGDPEETPGDPVDLSDDDLGIKVNVTVDGESKPVTLKEALEGYVRTETFHKRMSQLHEAAQAVEKEFGEAQKVRVDYAQKIVDLAKELDLIMPKRPSETEMDEMYRTDPAQARAIEKAWSNFDRTKMGLKEEYEKTAKETRDTAANRRVEWIKGEQQKTLAANPDWNSPKKIAAAMTELRGYAKQVGFSDDEMDNVHDHRMFAVLKDAAAYRKLMANKPRPSVIAREPGDGKVARNDGPRRRIASRGSQPMKRLAREGSIDAAADVFKTLI